MKKLILALILMILPSLSHADEYVNGYYRSNGTHVNGYYRSSPNSTVTDNYSYKGNYNPYTGKRGYNSYGSL